MNMLKKIVSGMMNSGTGANVNQNTNRHPLRDVIHTDLAIFCGSSICPICSSYNKRVYSISGKDRRFPPLSSLPNALHDGKCDLCGKCYGLSSYYEGVSKPDVKTAIQISNMPIIDKRTPEQKQWFYEEQTNPKKKKKKP